MQRLRVASRGYFEEADRYNVVFSGKVNPFQLSGGGHQDPIQPGSSAVGLTYRKIFLSLTIEVALNPA